MDERVSAALGQASENQPEDVCLLGEDNNDKDDGVDGCSSLKCFIMMIDVLLRQVKPTAAWKCELFLKFANYRLVENLVEDMFSI